MKLYIDESEYDDLDYDYDDYYDDETAYYYNVEYYTYYKDEFNMYCPLAEVDKSEDEIIPMDDETDPLLYVTKIESDINNEVQSGEYKGLYVHYITVPIYSNYKQIDVDRWVGSSSIDSEEVYYESEEIPMPEDYNEDDYTELDLAEYAEDYVRGENK